MRKKIIIVVLCLLVAAIMTGLITRSANKKYDQYTKTSAIVCAKEYIPAGTIIRATMLEDVSVPESIKGKFKITSDIKEIEGKTLLSAVMPGNPVFINQIDQRQSSSELYRKIGVQVNQAQSDQVLSGDRVDVYQVINSNNEHIPGRLIAENIRVVASYDQSGNIIVPGNSDRLTSAKSKIPSMVELEILPDQAPTISSCAASRQIYIIRR